MNEYSGQTPSKTRIVPISTNPKDAFGRQKPGISNIPPVALIHEAMAMKNGADKYGPFNWRKTTVSLKVYADAAYRHLMRYLDGENIDPESGIHHLGHLRADAGILLDAAEQGTLIDDRPTPGKASEVLERLTRRTGEPSRRRAYTVSVDFAGSGTTEPRKRRVYIAGPMRGIKDFNFPAFDRARDLANVNGLVAISPADIDRENGIHETTELPQSLEEAAHVNREFVERDVKALLSLRAELGDAIALLPGWEKSTGAVAEFFIARWLGLNVLDAEDMCLFTEDQIHALSLHPLISNTRRYLGRHG